jgi:hypothetical protein
MVPLRNQGHATARAVIARAGRWHGSVTPSGQPRRFPRRPDREEPAHVPTTFAFDPHHEPGAGRLAVATAVASTALGLLASPASAASVHKCSLSSTVDTCIEITRQSSGDYLVHVGIEVHIGFQEGQTIIDQPGEPFTLSMWGADPLSDDELAFGLFQTDIGADEPNGLGASFDGLASHDQLNEDDSFFDDTDEIFAHIDLRDQRTSVIRHFQTPEVSGKF